MLLADHQIPVFATSDRPAPTPPLDAGPIVASLGDLAYTWNIETDVLSWGENATAFFASLGTSTPVTGDAFARLVHESGGQSRFDAVLSDAADDRSPTVDSVSGIAFRARYALCASAAAEAVAQTLHWVEDRGCWTPGENGRPRSAQGMVRLLEERREVGAEPEIPLAGRDALLARLAGPVAAGQPATLLLFAAINVIELRLSYGLAVAEEVVQAVARLLRANVRAADLVIRWPGQACVVLLSGCTRQHAGTVAARLADVLRRTRVPTAAGHVDLSIRVGGSVLSDDVRDPALLLRQAEDALEEAVDADDLLPVIQGGDTTARLGANRVMARQMAAALDAGRVRLAFQPIVSARTRDVFCHESLIRLETETGEVLSPGLLMPLAERNGMVRRVDLTALQAALAHLANRPDATVTVNVSPVSAHDSEWRAAAIRAVADCSGAARRLIVEITETAAVKDLAATKSLVDTLKGLGVRFAVDDFGSGHSSFRNLRHLGVDLLKLDGTFTRSLLRSTEDGYFVRTLIDLAQHLGIATVAEWVEDEETAALLTEWGIDYLQGHLIGKAE